ncbi:MAG: hypothetical protein IPF97_04675 [Sphingomonadales bacterium]|nr:hypothetical protein [Sphingomonadales bacterium]
MSGDAFVLMIERGFSIVTLVLSGEPLRRPLPFHQAIARPGSRTFRLKSVSASGWQAPRPEVATDRLILSMFRPCLELSKQNKNKPAAAFERLVPAFFSGSLDHILPDIFDLPRRILASPGNHPVVLQETIVNDLLPEFRIFQGPQNAEHPD